MEGGEILISDAIQDFFFLSLYANIVCPGKRRLGYQVAFLSQDYFSIYYGLEYRRLLGPLLPIIAELTLILSLSDFTSQQ